MSRDPKPKTAIGRLLVRRDRNVKRGEQAAYDRNGAEIQRLIGVHDRRKNRKTKRVTGLLAALAMLAVLLVAAPPAEAANFYTCPQALQSKAFKCTYILATVHVLDRTTGTVRTWYRGTSVGLAWWTYDTGIHCGVNGDNFVWAVKWLDTYNLVHWAVIGDWWLDTGTSWDWGPQPSDWTGTHTYNPDRQAASTGSGYCNSSNWAFLEIGG